MSAPCFRGVMAARSALTRCGESSNLSGSTMPMYPNWQREQVESLYSVGSTPTIGTTIPRYPNGRGTRFRAVSVSVRVALWGPLSLLAVSQT